MRRLLPIAMPSGLARSFRRRIAATMLAALIALAGSVAAWAYWPTIGAGTGAGSVGTLNPPTGVAASSVPGSGAVSVSWTASAVGTGAVAPQGYYITRTAGTTTTAACGTSPSSPAAGTSCSDTSVPDGTYTYRVTAVYHTWTAGGATSSAVTVTNDVTPPTGSITFPGSGGILNATGWMAACGTPSTNDICGTASDASGVQQVQVSILQVSTGRYWNGTGFSSTAEAFQTATLSSPNATTTGWSYPLAVPAPDGNYALHVVTRDIRGNGTPSGTYTATATFTTDTVAPTATSINRSGANPINAGPLSFSVTFSEPVKNVATGNFSLTTSGLGGTAPTITGVSPASGLNTTYTVTVSTTGTTGTNSGSIRLDLSSVGTIQDAATNLLAATRTGDQAYTYDTAAPAVSSINRSGTNPINAGPLSFSVTFSEPVKNVAAGNFSLTTSGLGGTAPTITGVSPTSGLNTTYTVTVSTTGTTGTNSGSIRLDLSSVGTIQDAATNLLAATRTGDQAYTYDTTAPVLTALQMFDIDANGKVDQVKATFGETLASSTATAPWTLSNVPSGGSLASVSTSGSVATLTLNEGAGPASTAVGSFTIALAASASGIRDAAGNQVAFAATALVDKAGPVPISISSANKTGGTAGQAEAGDTITVTFSEPLAALGSTSSTVTLSTSNGAGKAINLMITGMSGAAFQIGTKNGYLTGNGGTSATFNSSTLAEPTSTQVRVTLGTWDGSGSLSAGGFVSGTTSPLLPATSITDPSGNSAAGSLAITIGFF